MPPFAASRIFSHLKIESSTLLQEVLDPDRGRSAVGTINSHGAIDNRFMANATPDFSL